MFERGHLIMTEGDSEEVRRGEGCMIRDYKGIRDPLDFLGLYSFYIKEFIRHFKMPC